MFFQLAYETRMMRDANRFQIPMDDIQVVEVLDTTGNLHNLAQMLSYIVTFDASKRTRDVWSIEGFIHI